MITATNPGSTFIESGEAFRRLSGIEGPHIRERFDVVVIGGGQAGLSVGYHLRSQGLRFVILDAAERTGDAWRKRWDSLRLFTPAKLDGLPGMRFPGLGESFPTKDDMADYLESYAARFALPVRNLSRVEKLGRRDGKFTLTVNGGEIEADQVVVAMASYQAKRVPAFASQLRPDIVQLHSADYRSPAQLRDGHVLVVGAGNSGAEIAKELVGRHPVWISGRDVGEIPFRIEGFAARWLLTRLMLRGIFHRLLTVRTPIGRRVRPKFIRQGGPLIRTKMRDLLSLGSKRVGKIVGVRDGLPLLSDGSSLDAANVVWCTGFHAGFQWIALPALGEDGEPEHVAGTVPAVPGLYFVGLHFLYAASSTMIHGVSRDARRIAKAVVRRARASRAHLAAELLAQAG